MKTRIGSAFCTLMCLLLLLVVLSCNENETNKALPGIGITAPQDKSTLTSGTDIKIQAYATDDNGTVARMDFYEGTNKLGEDDHAPYEYVWPKVKAGAYTLAVTAVDDQGNELSSASINVTVTDPQ